jgi:hypothetical protein
LERQECFFGPISLRRVQFIPTTLSKFLKHFFKPSFPVSQEAPFRMLG